MISVESRYGRRRSLGLGLGFGGGGSSREMEETELEEGEAYGNNYDDDDNIDPDVALSYLDEKVQVVLGHFQKDFEGGVSAENLGAKYGGYGSFLPTHQRSPSIWSQPKTPQKVQSYETHRSPNNLLMEGDFQNSAVSSGATSSVKHGTASTSAPPPPISRPPFLESSSKKESSLLSVRGSRECDLNKESLNKPNNKTDQKTLKVRLKVGSDNMAQKAAAIFSDLGFPLSSPEDSPDESGGLTPEFRESPGESPTSILQIMASSPVPDGLLLTPLPDSLLHLTEKEKLLRDNRPVLACRDSQGGSSMFVDEFSSMTGEGKVLGGKKIKQVEKSIRLIEMKNEIVQDVGNGISGLLNKEIDIETPEGRELVADSLKLPILSNSKYKIGETTKGTNRVFEVSGEIKKFKVKDRFIPSDYVKDSESITSQDANTAEKLKLRVSSGDKVQDDRKEKVRKDVQSLSGKDGKSKGNKSFESYKFDIDGSKGRKEPNGGTIDPPENKVKLKMTSLERDGGKLPFGMEQTSSRGKKKSKGSKNKGSSAAELSQENSRVVSSAASKDKKKSSGDSSSKNKMDDSKLCRESGKTRETYRDIFGDEEMEQAEHSMNSFETPFRDRPKNCKLEVEKETRQFTDKAKDRSSGKEIHQFADKSRERPNGKKVENTSTSEVYQNTAQNVAPAIENELVSNTVPAAVSVINENWVACDRCQKWRLLPYYAKPNHLPKKWLCSMQTWLPGMNHCSISEDETTKIMHELNAFPTPAPESQNSVLSQPNGTVTGLPLPQVQHLDLKHQDHSLLGVPSGGKKKHGVKKTADATSVMGPMQPSNSVNKNQQASLKSISLNDVNQPLLDSYPANKAGMQHLSKSSDSVVEKHRHKQKDKHKLAPDGGIGFTNHTKIISKREADQDGSRTSKKIKTEGLFNTEEEWNSDYGGAMGSSGPTSTNYLSAKASARGMKKHGEYSSSKESKFDSKDNLLSSAKKPKELVQDSLDVGALDVGKSESRDMITKKRKVKEWQESQAYPSDPLTDVGLHLEANKVSLEGTSESELKKGKKARVSKSEGKESRKSMGDTRTDRRDRAPQIVSSSNGDFVADEMEEGKSYLDKDQQQSQYQRGNVVSQQMLDSVDLLKRDLTYGLPSLAATSSSSKVSGSRKSKTNFQEAKGSPVESVSSSPLRISNKGTSARRIFSGKDDATNGGFSVIASLRRCSDGEGDGGGGHSGSVGKEKTHSVVHRGSLESSVFDYSDREVNPTSGGKAKAPTDPSRVEFGDPHLVNGSADTLDQCLQRVELLGKEHGHDDEQMNKHYGSNGSLSRKPGKSSSSRSKDKHKGSKSDVDKGKIKVSDPLNNQEGLYSTKNSRKEAEIEPQDLLHYHEESRGGKYNYQEKYGVKDEKNYSGKKEYLGKWSNEGRRENQSKFGGSAGTDVKFSAACSKDGKFNAQQNSMQDRLGERSSHQSLSDRPDHDQLETAFGRGKSQSVPHSGDKQETQTRCPRPMPSTHKGNGTDVLRVDASGASGGDELKLAKQLRKPDNQAGATHNSLRHSTPSRVVPGDLDGPSPVRKDSSSQAANAALKEARDLKHSADRLKNSGSGLESTGLYFEAVLKFLHGASLIEPCNVESSRHGESQSVHVYSTTTGLCEFVAQEYERCKEMAFAALAYKCLEVACMRVVYFRHWSINKDRQELRAALDMVPPGESPSSSASDVDNLNNQGTVDKVALAKGVGSPHVAGNHVIAARNRPSFVRMLNFTQDVNSAMEASRKSQNAFAAASASVEESQFDGISSVKRALDFNFHDVQGLLRLVRLAMEALSR